jgi:hypothetical protein
LNRLNIAFPPKLRKPSINHETRQNQGAAGVQSFAGSLTPRAEPAAIRGGNPGFGNGRASTNRGLVSGELGQSLLMVKYQTKRKPRSAIAALDKMSHVKNIE